MLADLNCGGDDRLVCHTVLYYCKIYICLQSGGFFFLFFFFFFFTRSVAQEACRHHSRQMLILCRNVSFINGVWLIIACFKNISSGVVGQFVRAVQLRGGNRLRLGGEVPGTGRPVHQRGSVPAIRRSFSEG